MALYLTSDLHLGHLRALEIMPHRPWTTVDDMNEGLINNYNKVVAPMDICIFLGDVVMGKKFENVPKFLPRLNGIKILVAGNHDWLAEECKGDKFQQMTDLYLKHGMAAIYHGCIKLSEITGESVYDSKVNLCHFPPANTDDPRSNEYDQRYSHLRPIVADDEYLFHGHTHSETKLTAENILHIGVDAWDMKPVSLLEVNKILKFCPIS